MKCLMCGRESKDKFCKWCKNIKRKAIAIVSQNKSKLTKLLLIGKCKYTPQRFNKFNLYTSNIQDYGKVLIEYRAVDTRYTIEKLLTYWTILNSLVGTFFIFELILISC